VPGSIPNWLAKHLPGGFQRGGSEACEGTLVSAGISVIGASVAGEPVAAGEGTQAAKKRLVKTSKNSKAVFFMLKGEILSS
jgi:hypothetical protein